MRKSKLKSLFFFKSNYAFDIAKFNKQKPSYTTREKTKTSLNFYQLLNFKLIFIIFF